MTSPAPIVCDHVGKTFGSLAALQDVSLTIEPGTCVALVGPNGAGKSTLFKLVLGLIGPDSGAIEILGQSPQARAFSRIKEQIGFLPEQILFHGALTGRETLRFYSLLKRAPLAPVPDLLDLVGLLPAADRRVSTYSKGMRQRLGLAQALIGSPRLLLLDEPATGLDPDARRNLFRIVDQQKQRGAAILVSSHILTELEARTDRIAILDRGRLMANGSLGELVQRLELPSRIIVRAGPSSMQQLSDRFSQRLEAGRPVNGQAVLSCSPNEKLSLLKELMRDDVPFDGLEIVEPSLDQVFAAYTSGGSVR